jgi:predicted small metal-binding protein
LTISEKGADMNRIIKCECGYVAQGKTDEEVVRKVEEHLASDHPELLEKVSRDDIFGWIEVVS